MAVNGSILYTILSLVMVTLGSSFYALINHSETELPKEFCVIQSLLLTTAGNATSHQGGVVADSSWTTTPWITLSILLPSLVFILDGWHQRLQASAWSTWWTTWTFWTTAYHQHAPWMWHHLVGQTMAFGTTEFLRYFMVTPNDAFWQQCHSNNATLPSPGCQPNATSLPLLVSHLCLDETQSLETHLLTLLMQNLHSMPNLYLVCFGNATFIFLYVFYKHPLRLKVPTHVLAFIGFIYLSFFFSMSLFFYQAGQVSFLDILISFLYGLFLQSMLYLMMQKKEWFTSAAAEAIPTPSKTCDISLPQLPPTLSPSLQPPSLPLLPIVRFYEEKNTRV